MIIRDPRYPIMTPTQVLGEIMCQELVDQDVEKSLTLKMGKSLALNDSSSEVVESKPKPPKSKKEDTSDEGSTDEETAFAIKKYKKILKSRALRNGGNERKKKSQRKCYECGEYGHFIAECPNNMNKNEEEKKYKENSKEYKNKYQRRAHVGQQWDSPCYSVPLWCLWAFQTLLCLCVGPVPLWPIVWLWVIYWHPLYFLSWLCLDYALVVLILSFITSVTNE
jgi:hypothetical protein